MDVPQSVKEINRLINNGMSNIYWKVVIEKNWPSQNFFISCLFNESICSNICEVSYFVSEVFEVLAAKFLVEKILLLN